MSIVDFKSALKDRAYAEWFKKSSKSIFIQTGEQLRPFEQTAQKTSFLVTENDIKEMGEKLAGRSITDAELSKIRSDMLHSIRRNRVVDRKDNSLFFPIVGFKTGISNILEKGFASIPRASIVDAKTGIERERQISDYFQKGHVFSIATNITEQTKRNLSASNAPESVKNLFIPILEEYIARLRADDLASANISSSTYDLYAKYSKNPYKYIVEMQGIEKNQASGVTSAPLTNALRRYFNPQSAVEIEKFFRTRASEDNFIQKLITSKGSPSMVELIVEEVLHPLTGKKQTNKTYNVPNQLLGTIKNKVDTTAIRKSIKDNISLAKKTVQGLKKAVASTNLRTPKGQFYSLASLQLLLDANLQHVIAANMGNGTDRKVLNYRSGRFAASAQVERLSASREGMITAFYSYMKNPYQTFSEGGRQSSPISRDPKLLISKSIREIAATKIGNRMRAVSI